MAIIGGADNPGCSLRTGNLCRFALGRVLGVAGLLIVVGGCSISPLTHETFQTSDGVTLSVLEAGAQHVHGNNLQIAFIPGWSMPAWLWRSQLQHFGQEYYTLALDPRGQGESEIPSGGYTAERRATDIRDFLQPLSHVLLVGWSLGALEALQYIQMYGTDRLAGLVLVDSSVGEEPAPAPGGSFKQRLREDRDAMLREFVRAIFAKPLPEPQLDQLFREAERMPLKDSLTLLSYPFERTHWREIARSFDKPLLYVVTPRYAEQAANLKKNRQGTQVEVFPEAGHALFVDEPDKFNRLIDEFAKSLSKHE